MINLTDILSVMSTFMTHLVVLGVLLVAGIVALVALRRVKRPARSLARSLVGIAMAAAAIITGNLILTGPLASTMSFVSGGDTALTQASIDASTALCETIAGEGIVLLENDGELPLPEGTHLSVFGWASTAPVYGGSGSGALSDEFDKVSLLDGLVGAGFELDDELSAFYTAYRAERPQLMFMSDNGFGFDWTLPEPPVDTYPDDLVSGAREFSSTALLVISRAGGEETDIPANMSQQNYDENSPAYADFPDGAHYLELSQTERDLVDMVTANFDDVILVYNGSNPFELGFVEDYPQIKGVLWCPATGQNGFAALGRILAGQVNPSAKTTDTFLYDVNDNPSSANYGSFHYDNMDEFTAAYHDEPTVPSFVDYVEGIYVGYRYYETAAEEGVLDYDTTVQYPFGYGLSYTQFSQEMGPIVEKDGTISFDVTVTNTGDVAGKSVVEAYVSAPYENGGIEKASAVLVAFDKTGLLEPGQSQTLTLSVNLEDIASFDAHDRGCYVLEAGDYAFSIRSDSHTVIASQTWTLDDDVVYGEGNGRASDQVAATVQLADIEGDVTYLSRADHFANREEALAAPATFSMPDDQKSGFTNNSNYDPTAFDDPSDEMPVQRVDHGLTIGDLYGADYDDERWDQLVDQMTVDEMNLLIGLAYGTQPIESIGKPETIDMDGPMNITNHSGQSSIGFPCEVMMANTWNVELAYEFGQQIGVMADELGSTGWFAPAMNIHRHAFQGRSYEYYSEDPVLSGKLAVQAIRGAEESGVYAYIKHFALNEQDINRNSMLCTWASEQAVREVYLKPFEISVKEGDAKAVMSSFNYLGNTWAGAKSALLQTILRDEWGFHGMVMTDYFGDAGNGYLDADQAIRNGGDGMLLFYDTGKNMVEDLSATSVIAMRRAARNILYVTGNSRACAPEGIVGGLPTWMRTMYTVDAVAGIALVALALLSWQRYRKAVAA